MPIQLSQTDDPGPYLEEIASAAENFFGIESPMPYIVTLVVIAIVFAAIAFAIGHRDKDDLLDEKPKRMPDPWDDDDDDPEEDDDVTDVMREDPYWICAACDAIFESAETPNTCPCCGLPLVSCFPSADDEDSAYICPTCGPYIAVEETGGSTCPVCGKNSAEAAIVTHHPAKWLCSECDVEFTTPGNQEPTICPCCETKFPPDRIRKEAKKIHLCASCGKTFFTIHDDPVRCPACGERLSRKQSDSE